jgi:hypothetical protein
MATAKDMNLLMRSVMVAMIVKGAICRGEFLPLGDQGNRCNGDKIRNKRSAFLQFCLTKALSNVCQKKGQNSAAVTTNLRAITDNNMNKIQIQSRYLIQKLRLVGR